MMRLHLAAAATARATMLAVLALAAMPAATEEVYKSIDASGAVTYGDRPLEDAIATEALPVEPGPSEQEVESARARAEQAIQQADELAQARAEKQQAREQRSQQAQPTYIVIDRGEDGRPVYGWSRYPHRPWPPGQPYPPAWPGPGDHPAYRPRPPVYPTPLPEPPPRPAPPQGRVHPIR